jgi:hypothetical protein
MREWFPLLRDLFFPYRVAPIKIGKPFHGWEAFAANPFPFFLLICTLTILWPARNRQWAMRRACAGTALLIIAGVILHRQHGASTKFMSPAQLEATLSTLPLQGAVLHGPPGQAAKVWSYPNRFAEFQPLALTTLREAPDGYATVTQSEIEPNDWAERGYRWFTLVEPFSPGRPGPRRFRMQGALDGDAQIHMVIRQNHHILVDDKLTLGLDQTFDYATVIRTPAWHGHVYLLFRVVEGNGTLRFDQVEWSALVNESGKSTPSVD